MIVSTTLFLAAGRFGLAPTSNAHTKAGVKLYEENDSGVASNDPSGTHGRGQPNPNRSVILARSRTAAVPSDHGLSRLHSSVF